MTKEGEIIMTNKEKYINAFVEALEVEDAEGYPMYSVSEIAEQFDVTGSEVQYIYNTECCGY